jgi:DNA polymerase zeta
MSELADAIVMTGRDHLNHAKLEIDFSRDRRCNCSRDRNSDSNSNSYVSHNSNSDSYNSDSYNSNSNRSKSSSVSLSCNCSNVWDRAKVVYGDTDSVFIQLPNRSKAEAFKIGAEVAGYISSLCPGVMKLKFEKVYTNSVLVSKKRYVGEKYESLGQKKGELEAKGIEMVRRDQCPLVMMVQEAALKIFFETRDLVKLKDFLVSQWSLILQGKLTSKEFIFRREVKSNYVASYEPPGKVLVMKKTKTDPAYICPYAWRVPYVSVVPPGDVKSPLLVDLAKSPEEFLRRGSNYRLNYIYYIMKCLNPALSRVFSLGDLASCVDIQKWYAEMPKIKIAPVAIKYDIDGGSGHGNDTRGSGSSSSSSGLTVTTNINTSGSDRRGGHQSQLQISSFLASICLVCGSDNVFKPEVLCVSCLQNPQGSYSILLQRWNRTQESEHKLMLVCQHCSKHRQAADSLIRGRLIGKDACENVDCRFFHERLKKVNELDKLMFLLKKMLLDW